MTDKVKIREIMLGISFFCLGLNKAALYFPAFLIYLLLSYQDLISFTVRKTFSVLAGLTFTCVAVLFIVGQNRLTVENPLKVFLWFLFSILFAGCLLQRVDGRLQARLIVLYILGIGMESFLIASYSFFSDPLIYGYGNVLNPFTGLSENSPKASNNLSILAALFIFFIFKSKNSCRNFLFLLPLIAVNFCAFFLAGRAFFVIFFITLSYLFFINLKSKPIGGKLLSVFMVLVSLPISKYCLEIFGGSSSIVSSRLEEGLKSPRFGLYARGLELFWSHPFGGYSVDTKFLDTKWFHNIFLDIGRLAGWAPVFVLLIAMLYVLRSVRIFRDGYFKFGFLFFIISFLIMQQDVVIEGNPHPFVLLFYCGILMLSVEEERTICALHYSVSFSR